LGNEYAYFIPNIDGVYDRNVSQCPKCTKHYTWIRLYPGYFQSVPEGPFGDFTTLIGEMAIRAEKADSTFSEHDNVRLEPIVVCNNRGLPLKSYKGPAYVEIVRQKVVPFIWQLSSLDASSYCEVCRRIYFQLSGVEQEPDADQNLRPRQPGKGVCVSKAELGEHRIFRVRGLPFTFCTASFKEHVEQLGLTNVIFREYGEVVETENQ